MKYEDADRKKNSVLNKNIISHIKISGPFIILQTQQLWFSNRNLITIVLDSTFHQMEISKYDSLSNIYKSDICV